MINANTAREAAEMFMTDHDNPAEQMIAEIEYFIMQVASRGEKEFTYYFTDVTFDELTVVIETLADAGYGYLCDYDRGIITIAW